MVLKVVNKRMQYFTPLELIDVGGLFEYLGQTYLKLPPVLNDANVNSCCIYHFENKVCRTVPNDYLVLGLKGTLEVDYQIQTQT